MSRQTVLIVDDELNLLRALRDAVRTRSWDVDVLTAGNAEEALELLALRVVDVLVTDIRMPGADGLALIEEVRDCYPQTQCLVMTAHVDSTSEAAAMQLGAVSFIRKPFELDAFLSEIGEKLQPRGFRGTSLMGFSLTDILQLAVMNGQALTFEISSSGRRGMLAVESGLLLAASTDDKAGIDAAQDILSWSDGEITSEPHVEVIEERRLNCSLTEILMQAAKEQDEQTRRPTRANRRATAVEALVVLLEELEHEVGGFLGSIVHLTDGSGELGGIKADVEFPREWLRDQLPPLFKMIQKTPPRSGDHALHRIVIEMGELSLVAVSVGDGNYLWTSAVRGSQFLGNLQSTIDRLIVRVEECIRRIASYDSVAVVARA